MATIDDVFTRSPRVLMIQGREHVLYQGSFERIRIADSKLLWLNAAKEWALALFVGLMVADYFVPDSVLWLVFAALPAVVVYGAVSFYMDSRSVLGTPFSIVERDRSGTSSTLSISTKSTMLFSMHPTVTHIATAHTDMADFLVGAYGVNQPRGFRQRPRIPTELAHPTARLHRWSSVGAFFTIAASFVVLVVFVFTR